MIYHLAQLNIAQMAAPLDDPLMAGFVAQLAAVNALADISPGFVWRLQEASGDATALRVFNDPLILINMSVWESIESLSAYVYQGAHRAVLQRRREWFRRADGPTTVLWWVPAGHQPSVEEAKDRLDRLRVQGPTVTAFTFATSYPIPAGALIGG